MKSVGSPGAAEGHQCIASYFAWSPFPVVTLQGRRVVRTFTVTTWLPGSRCSCLVTRGNQSVPSQACRVSRSSLIPRQGLGNVLLHQAQLNTEGLNFLTKAVTSFSGASSRFYLEKKKNQPKKQQTKKHNPFCW